MRVVYNRYTQVGLDLAVLSLALWLAFALRFDWSIPREMLQRALTLWVPVVVFQYVLLWALNVPRFSWRHVGLREVLRIALAAAIAGAFLSAYRFIGPVLLSNRQVLPFPPLGVVTIDAVLLVFLVGGVRVARRVVGERRETGVHRATGRFSRAKRVILLGAGQAGAMVAREIALRPDLGLKPVGFLDDDPRKRGLLIHGVPVLGTTEELASVRLEHRVEQAIISIANAPGAQIRRMQRLCQAAGLPANIIPGLYELVGGRVELSRLRPVAIEDLLRREQVALDEASIRQVVEGRAVLVTGAGGSIGSELCRQVLRFGARRLVLYERSENALYEIHRELNPKRGPAELVPALGDVSDRARLQAVFSAHEPEVVLHAAAHKHVPMVEANPGEAVKNNLIGTRITAEVAHESGVKIFVLISTDKAVNPTSVMGATKRGAERVIQALSQTSSTRFVAVRFGNVLGSAGSVVPLFKEQIARGGPVTVTHPDMQRYFMTIPEACQLVLQSAALGNTGEILVLDMGEPVRIADLARDLIRLSGYEPDREIAIEFSGLRPGEKLFEELSLSTESASKTRHPKIWVGRISPATADEIWRCVHALARESDSSPERVRAALCKLVPEYCPSFNEPLNQRGSPPTADASPIGRAACLQA
nr:nucleoside-diphosphate sugar epimerase/dehydratase [Nitrosomonas nitrosa]